MYALDWIFIAALLVGGVLGFIRGFLKPLFSILGFIVVAYGTSLLSPVFQRWMMNSNMSDSVRSIVALVIAAVLLLVICGIASFFLRKLIARGPVTKLVNRIIGSVLGIVIVYLAFAIIVAFVGGPMGDIAGLNEKYGDAVNSSWIARHLYAKNPFGNLVVNKMAEKMLEIIEKSTSQPDTKKIIEIFGRALNA